MLPTIVPMPTITRLNRFCAVARTSAVVCSSTIMNATKMKHPKHSPWSAMPAITNGSEGANAQSAMRAA